MVSGFRLLQKMLFRQKRLTRLFARRVFAVLLFLPDRLHLPAESQRGVADSNHRPKVTNHSAASSEGDIASARLLKKCNIPASLSWPSSRLVCAGWLALFQFAHRVPSCSCSVLESRRFGPSPLWIDARSCRTSKQDEDHLDPAIAHKYGY